jgi:deoxyribonuclease-1
MHLRYEIPFDRKSLALFKVWNKIDPPSKQEKMRNNTIEKLQGNRNPFIDKPTLADTGKLSMMKLSQ